MSDPSPAHRLGRPPVTFFWTALLAAAVLTGCAGHPSPRLGPVPAGYTLVYQQDFDGARATAGFHATDPSAWRLHRDATGGALDLHAASDYRPPHRSPLNIAVLAAPAVGSFVLEAELQQTGREYDHRDLCVFFAVQGASRYYYAHLATKADDSAHHVHIVDNAPRTPVTSQRSAGVDWGRDRWHVVRVERDAAEGLVRVWLDDPAQPVLTARDATIVNGRIGFGSFDDTGRIDNVRLWAPAIVDAGPPPFPPLAPAASTP